MDCKLGQWAGVRLRRSRKAWVRLGRNRVGVWVTGTWIGSGIMPGWGFDDDDDDGF